LTIKSLRDRLIHGSGRANQYLHAIRSNFCLNDLLKGSSLSVRRSELYGRSVLVATRDQLTAALTMIELDGCARRITILPPDVETNHIGAAMAAAAIDAVVLDRDSPRCAPFDLAARVVCTPSSVSKEQVAVVPLHPEWVLLTSGTVGVPKIILHDLASLTAPVAVASPADGAAVWGTFYDIRRYGGLQIFLRAVLGGASLVLSSVGEPVGDHLARLAKHGVTHISGTPSHWRRAMTSPAPSGHATFDSLERLQTKPFSTAYARHFRRPLSVTLMLRPKPASPSMSTMVRLAFQPHSSARPATAWK
jgi:non-ribosomal peptide synthetase component F